MSTSTDSCCPRSDSLKRASTDRSRSAAAQPIHPTSTCPVCCTPCRFAHDRKRPASRRSTSRTPKHARRTRGAASRNIGKLLPALRTRWRPATSTKRGHPSRTTSSVTTASTLRSWSPIPSSRPRARHRRRCGQLRIHATRRAQRTRGRRRAQVETSEATPNRRSTLHLRRSTNLHDADRNAQPDRTARDDRAWDGENYTFYETTQAIVNHQRTSAQMLGVPKDKIRVITQLPGIGLRRQAVYVVALVARGCRARATWPSREAGREPRDDVPERRPSSQHAAARAGVGDATAHLTSLQHDYVYQTAIADETGRLRRDTPLSIARRICA